MDEDQGYYELNWDSIIGLNPQYIWFVVENAKAKYGPITLNDIDIENSNCYFISSGILESKAYSDLDKITLQIPSNYPSWFDYYVQIDETEIVGDEVNVIVTNYYKMEKDSNGDYIAYIPKVLSNEKIYITSNIELDDVIKTTELPHDVGYVYNLSNYITTSEYYLSGTINGYTTNNPSYQFTSYNNKYFLFVNLSDDITYDIVNTLLSDLELGSGYHMIVLDVITNNDLTTYNLDVYSNYLTYKVNYVYGDNIYTQYYKLGDYLQDPGLTPSPYSTVANDFTFDGWKYNEITYGANHDDISNLRVTSDMTLYSYYKPEVKKYNVIFQSQNNYNGSPIEFVVEVDYGKRLSAVLSDQTVIEKINPIQSSAGDIKGWFKGWYLDQGFDLLPDNHIVRDDVTLYANFIFEGMYLIGTIEGYNDWGNPRLDYRFENITEGNDEKTLLRHIYLQKDDIVKIYSVISVNDDKSYEVYWLPSSTNVNDEWSDVGDVKSNSKFDNADKNLEIGQSGYYTFEYKEKQYGGIVIEYTWQQYLVYYDYNGGTTTGIDQDFVDYRFNMDGNGWEILTRVDVAQDDARRTPLPTNGDLILYGWFDEANDGQRITKLTPEMMYKNKITLYAQYIKEGYYINGSDISNLLTNTAMKITVTEDNPLKLYYFEGSAQGSSNIATMEITGHNAHVYGEQTWGLEYVPGGNGTDSYNIVTGIPNGTYDVSLELDSQGNVVSLVIDQSHTVTYVMGELGEILGTSGVYTTSEKYKSAVKPFTFTSNSSNVTFIGWIDKNGTYINEITCDITLYAVYRLGTVTGDIPGHTHIFTNYGYDDDGHWQQCICGAMIGSKSSHSMINGYNDTHHWQECETCSYISGLATHTYNDTLQYNDRYHWIGCTGCEYQKDLTNHNYNNVYVTDGTYHWHECDCGAHDTKVAHIYSNKYIIDEENGTHTLVCEICNHENTNPHTFIYTAIDNEKHNAVCECGVLREEEHSSSDNKWYSDGNNHYKVCQYCNEAFEVANHIASASFTKDGEKHYKVCTQDGCGYHLDEATHSTTKEATPTSKASCYICGEYGTVLTSVTVYFSAPPSYWGNIAYIYYWPKNGNGNWPGVQMTYVETNEHGQRVYKATIDCSKYQYIKFHNNNGWETDNINIEKITDNTGWYIKNNSGNAVESYHR